MGYWGVVLNVLKNVDVLLLVADARLPVIAANEGVLSRAEKLDKRVVLVYNKCDLLSSRLLKSLRSDNPDAVFVSAKSKRGIAPLQSLLDGLSSSHSRGTLKVGLLGYPNTGKSTLLNVLTGASHAKVSGVSGTTKSAQWIRVGNLRFVDSPGVIPLRSSESVAAMLSSKDPHKLRDPERAAVFLVEFILSKYPGVLSSSYGVSEGSAYDTFEAVGLKKGFLLKGGVVDEHKTAIRILDDWQNARISLLKV